MNIEVLNTICMNNTYTTNIYNVYSTAVKVELLNESCNTTSTQCSILLHQWTITPLTQFQCTNIFPEVSSMILKDPPTTLYAYRKKESKNNKFLEFEYYPITTINQDFTLLSSVINVCGYRQIVNVNFTLTKLI